MYLLIKHLLSGMTSFIKSTTRNLFIPTITHQIPLLVYGMLYNLLHITFQQGVLRAMKGIGIVPWYLDCEASSPLSASPRTPADNTYTRSLACSIRKDVFYNIANSLSLSDKNALQWWNYGNQAVSIKLCNMKLYPNSCCQLAIKSLPLLLPRRATVAVYCSDVDPSSVNRS